MSTITNEQEFEKVKNTLAVRAGGGKFHSERFSELSRLVRESLSRQDSDRALILITRGALSFGSSDIHFDLTERDTEIRFRIDGSLVPVLQLERREYKLVLERLKYKSELKLNITHIPQDGKYRIEEDGQKIDVRVSTLPVKWGENVVCRVLDSSGAVPKLIDLGFMWTNKRRIDQSLSKTGGMVLVTGPTGSGKTTTLYSMLQELNTSSRKIITLEDPVEYELPGVVQSEVDEKGGYTYHNGLKALLRQDPDVIMIGEIRDLDTANIAAQSALTGHLVFSTLHTKSASETLERLMNMGVPSFILASSIDVIIAQRLVRRLCPHCSVGHQADMAQSETIRWIMRDIGIGAVERLLKKGFTLKRPVGCEHCGFTGFRGRVGIYEVLHFSNGVRDLVRKGESPARILEEGRKNDLILMREDGVLKALRGKTTLEEIFAAIG